MAKKEHNISADIIIKFLNADEGGNVSNNKCKQPSIIVVIPLNVTQIVVKTTKSRTSLHYTISVRQNTMNKDFAKLLGILWDLTKAILPALITRVSHYLQSSTFEDSVKKGVRIFLFIKRLLNWWDYLLYVFEHLNFDWVGGEYIANIFEHFL